MFQSLNCSHFNFFLRIQQFRVWAWPRENTFLTKDKLKYLFQELKYFHVLYRGHIWIIVKLRSRSRSGEGQLRVRRVIFGPELYPIFGFHPPPPHHKLFFGFKGPQTCHIDLGRVSMTQVWSEVVSISRWTTRWA